MFIKVKFTCKGQQKKYIIDYIPQYHPTVGHVIGRIIDACAITDLQPKELEIRQQGFILPPLLTSAYLNDKTVYNVMEVRDSNKKAVKKSKKIQKISPSLSNNKSQSRSSSEVKDSSSEQSSSSSSSVTPPLIKKTKNSPKISKNNKAPLQKNLRSNFFNPNRSQKQIIKGKKNYPTNKIRQKGHSLSQEASDSVSDSSLPVIPKKNVAKKQQKLYTIGDKPKLAKKDSIKSSSYGELSSPEAIEAKESHTKTVPKANPQKAKIIQQNKQVQRPQLNFAQKKRIPLPKKVIVKDSSSQSSQESSEKPKLQKKSLNVAKKVPISVRNKNSVPPQSIENDDRSRFQIHQEAQWISITKKILEEWEKQNEKQVILMNGNEVRFKIMDLDEEKFIPVLSGWISGTVVSTSGSANQLTVKLCNCVKNAPQGQIKSQYIKDYEIPLINIQELQIKRITLKQSQRVIEPKAREINKNREPVSIDAQKDEQKPPQSIQDFICGQISYYFSDKNYHTDLFMQMHANKDAQKYIPASFMLNFPKIKKVLMDQQKLWTYLVSDEKYKSRNYEIDHERRMIRKKNLAGRQGQGSRNEDEANKEVQE